MQKPVVNVCFDLPKPLPPALSCRRFWEADFYAEVRENRVAVPAFSDSELVRLVAETLEAPRRPEAKLTPACEPVSFAVGLVDKLLAS